MRPAGDRLRLGLARDRRRWPLVAAAIEREDAQPRQALDRAQESRSERRTAKSPGRLCRRARCGRCGGHRFRHVGQLVVDHMGDAVDVDAAGGDIGGHQGAGLAALKAASARSRWPWHLLPWMASALDARFSRRLATRSAPRLVRVKTMVRVSLGSANSSASRSRLRAASTRMTRLLDPVDGRGGRGDRDLGRIVQQLAGQLADLGRHGGREEQVLALLRQVATMRRIG